MSRRGLSRRSFVAAGLALAAGRAWAIEGKAKRVGVLSGGNERRHPEYVAQLGEAMRPHGWMQGRNLEFAVRYAYLAQTAAAARELVAQGLDAIVTAGTPRTLAILHETRSIPVVTELADPVAAGIARSLQAPGGNVTGMAYQPQEVTDKQFEMLKAVVTGLAEVRLIALSPLPTPAAYARARREIVSPLESAARRQGLAFDVSIASDPGGFAAIFATMRPGRSAAYFLNLEGSVDAGALAAQAIERRIATFHLVAEFVDAGGLMSYGFDFNEDAPVRTAAVLAKVLGGADPATIPFELPREQVFVVNRATARALGIEIAPEILIRATRVVG